MILASASQTRAKLLSDAGVTFDVAPARVDEEALKQSLLAEKASHRDIADALAELKALRVSASHPGEWVLGADQVLSFDGALVSKCESLAEARNLLLRLRGKTHDLIPRWCWRKTARRCGGMWKKPRWPCAIFLMRSWMIIWRRKARRCCPGSAAIGWKGAAHSFFRV